MHGQQNIKICIHIIHICKCVLKTPLEFHFIYLGNTKIQCIFRACCIISTESTNQMQQFLRLITCCLDSAQHVLGIIVPIIGSSTTAVAASGFTVGERW